MADIFVSYSSNDRALIERLVEQLTKAGYTVWWDQNLEGGSRFSKHIEDELIAAKVVVVAWTPNSIGSRWVADEADVALEHGTLLPISFGRARPPIGFRQHQTIDFADWNGDDVSCLDTLMRAIQAHVSGTVHRKQAPVDLPQSASVKSDASIAVLPFVNMSPDPEQEFFADGISEELLNLLAKIKELSVIARTSSFQFKGSDKNISEIGAILGVTYALEGSIRKAGNQVRITAQLIDTRNSAHLWSNTYDRTLEDIFAIQDEISAAIVEELKDLILGGEQMVAPHAVRVNDLEAYEHYLLGQQFLNRRSRPDFQRAQDHFEKVLAQEPNYLPALAGLAETYLLLSNGPGCHGTVPLSKALAQARPLIESALQIDGGSAEAHGVKAMYHLLDGKLEISLQHAQRSVALNPTYAKGYTFLAMTYTMLGDPTAPLMTTRRNALEHDPVSLSALTNLLIEYTERGRFKDAEALVSQAEKVDTAHSVLPFLQAMILIAKGELKEALAVSCHSLQNGANRSIHIVTGLAWRFGMGEALESHSPISAFATYVDFSNIEAARRMAKQVFAMEGIENNYQVALTLAHYNILEERYQEALNELTPFEETKPDHLGPHFSLAHHCAGATAMIFLLRHFGREEEAQEYLTKLRSVVDALRRDPDGEVYYLHHLSAVINICEGNVEACLDDLERRVASYKHNLPPHLLDANYEGLKDHPRYQKLLSDSRAHAEGQRAACVAEGLLPLPNRIVELFNTM